MRAPIIVAILAAGCTNVLDVDFETDPVGQPPLASPPSDAADAVEAFPGNAGGAVLVSAAGPLVGARSLELTGPSGTGTPSVFFHAAPLPHGSEPIHAFWRMDTNGFVRVDVTVVSDFTDEVISLIFEDNVIYVDGNSVGTTGFGPVGIALSLFPATDTWLLSVTGDAALEEEPTDGTILDAGALPAGHLTLRFDLLDANGATERLSLDAVVVNQRTP